MKSSLAKLAPLALLATLLTAAPAQAAASTVTTSGLALPAGVTLAETPVLSYESGRAVTLACMRFSYSGDPATLFFHDLTVNGGAMVGENLVARQTIRIPNDNAQMQPLCVEVATGDKVNTGGAFAIASTSAQTVVAQPTNLDFPAAFTTISTKLAAVGFTATSGYMAWSYDNDTAAVRYGLYVGVTPTTDISNAPVTLTIQNAVLKGSGGNPVSLTASMPTQTFSGEGEIDFGWSSVDLMAGLGTGDATPQLDADIAKVLPTTWTTTGSFPAGISFTTDPGSWYYNDFTQTTGLTVMVNNSGTKTVNLMVSKPKLYSVSGQTLTDLALPTDIPQLVTVPPKESMYVSTFTTGLPGDYRYDHALSFTATVKAVTPSSIDVKGLKLPGGYTMAPISFNNMLYDPNLKRTTFIAVINQPARGADKALVLSSGVFNGKAIPTAASDGYLPPEGNTRTFYLELGTVSGDVRTGKTYKLAGTIIAQTKTKFTSTAKLDNMNRGVAVFEDEQMWPPRPWAIDYDAAKKKSTIMVKMLNVSEGSARLGTCKVVLKVNGKAVTLLSKNVTVRSFGNPFVNMATVSGDLRYGATIAMSGTFKYGGC